MCEEYQRNYYLAGSLLKQIGTKSKQDLLNFHLARQKVSFSQFINNNQHELYHLFCSEKCCQCTSTILTKTQKVLNSKEMELLFNKMSKMHCHKPASTKAFCCSPSRIISYVDDLDITLLQCLLTNFCLDLFWRICLSNENKNLETFLDVNKHILFHLWKRNDKCCKSKDLSGRINDRQWAIIFETTHCGSNNIDACQFSVKKGIIEKNLDTGLARVIFGNICPLFMSIQKLAQSRNDLAHNTKGELSNMEYSTIWSNSTECIIAIARYLGKELEVKADIEVLKEKIPSFDVYKILHTHMLDTYKLQEDIRDNVIKLNEMFINESERTKAHSERTHKMLTSVMNQFKERESKRIMEEHDRADVKQQKQMISEFTMQATVSSGSQFQPKSTNTKKLEGAYSDDTDLHRFNCGKCKQMFEDYSSDKLIILILNHKQECPGKQVRSATPETSRDHIQETSIKIEVEGLSENYEDKTVQHLKATNGSEDPTISFESVDPTISYESVEKGSIIIWGRISKAFCYARTSVADVVEGFLGSFFISYPIETNDAVDITVKVGVVINEGNDLDDEGDCILCGKCKSEFIKVSQYISHQRTECKLRQLGYTEMAARKPLDVEDMINQHRSQKKSKEEEEIQTTDTDNFIKNAECGNVQKIENFIKNGISVNCKDSNGYTALHRAAGAGTLLIVKLLLQEKAHIDCTDIYGKTPLQWAAESGKELVVGHLIKKGASVNAKDEEKATALHWASGAGHSNTIGMLLLHGAVVNHHDISGQTALHWAASNGSMDTVETLLKGGAKKDIEDEKGMTPYDLARRFRHKEVQTLIQNFTEESLLKADANSDANIPNEHFPFPGISDANEFKKLIAMGTFESYENRVYLAGPCNSGKSSLASILIGGKVVTKWRSRDGLIIYFGRNGILLKKKKMIPLRIGENELILKLLRGKPNLIIEDTPITEDLPSGNESDHIIETEQQNATQMQTEEVSILTEKDVRTKLEQLEASIPKVERRKLFTSRKISNHTAICIHKDVLKELKDGKYKMEIAPSDLVDFGGQRSFDMTHQLFIQHKGTFVLMFDGSIGLYKPLKEYPQGIFTAASILTHWVNSILAYCGDSDDIMPIIVFAATHSDHFKEKEVKQKTKEYTEELTKIFSAHKHIKHIVCSRVFFVNATNQKDPEIENLTDHLVEIAFQQPSWGERKPIAWVPLEIVISEMKSRDVKLITKAEMKSLNESHNDFILNDIQFEHFLNIQHSLGKLLYFAFPGIDDFIVLQPPAVVNILRSFVTDECFWPKKKDLAKIHKDLHDSGSINKSDLFQLWNQKPFNEIMPDDDFKEYILQVLIHLDILIEPKRHTEGKSMSNNYLVPCIVKAIAPSNFIDKEVIVDRTLCLAYEMTDLSVPSALSFKIIAAALVVWPLKEEDGRPCLYYQSALMNVDERNELRILIEGQRVMVYLTNAESIHLISPDVAASIQECLTLALTNILKFYLQSSGKITVNLDVSCYFNIKVGLICHEEVCLVPLSAVKRHKKWTCKHEVKHHRKYPMYWIFDKKNERCPASCRGLERDALKLSPNDQHLVRLAKQIEVSVFGQFLIYLGLTTAEWEGIVYQYDRNGELGKKLMALYEWKKKREAKLQLVRLKDVSKALKKVDRQHCLCQILREDTCLMDITDSRLQEIPADEVLNRLPKHIGNCVIQLGIELGLSFNSIEETMHNHFKDMYSQTYDILKKWKQSSKIKPTIYKLMLALQCTDSGGLTFLRDEYLHP